MLDLGSVRVGTIFFVSRADAYVGLVQTVIAFLVLWNVFVG